MQNKKVRALTEGAISIALAEILSLLPLYKLPWGGSIDLGMLPILLFCVKWGFGSGIIACTAHGILQALLGSSGGFVGWQSLVGDYLLAYMALCVAGLFKGRYVTGALIACAARFLVHYVVGATIWAEYMPETFFGMNMPSPWVYSALYNGSYVLPCTVLVVVAGLILYKTPAKKYLQ